MQNIGGRRGRPLATYSGWSLRRSGFAEGALCGLNGIQIPLAKDGAERNAKGDPRPYIAERYGTRAGYVAQVEAAARRLQADGFLLEEAVLRRCEGSQAAGMAAAWWIAARMRG